MNALEQWWSSLQPRERLFVGGLGAFMVIFLLWFLLIDPLFAKAADLKTGAARAERELAYLQQAIPQLPASGKSAAPARASASRSLNVIVDQTRGRYQLTATNTQQVGADQLRVRLEDASFDSVVQWLGELRRQHGITIASASVNQTDVRGTTNATLTLSRAAQ